MLAKRNSGSIDSAHTPAISGNPGRITHVMLVASDSCSSNRKFSRRMNGSKKGCRTMNGRAVMSATISSLVEIRSCFGPAKPPPPPPPRPLALLRREAGLGRKSDPRVELALEALRGLWNLEVSMEEFESVRVRLPPLPPLPLLPPPRLPTRWKDNAYVDSKCFVYRICVHFLDSRDILKEIDVLVLNRHPTRQAQSHLTQFRG